MTNSDLTTSQKRAQKRARRALRETAALLKRSKELTQVSISSLEPQTNHLPSPLTHQIKPSQISKDEPVQPKALQVTKLTKPSQPKKIQQNNKTMIKPPIEASGSKPTPQAITKPTQTPHPNLSTVTSPKPKPKPIPQPVPLSKKARKRARRAAEAEAAQRATEKPSKSDQDLKGDRPKGRIIEFVHGNPPFLNGPQEIMKGPLTKDESLTLNPSSSKQDHTTPRSNSAHLHVIKAESANVEKSSVTPTSCDHSDQNCAQAIKLKSPTIPPINVSETLKKDLKEATHPIPNLASDPHLKVLTEPISQDSELTDQAQKPTQPAAEVVPSLAQKPQSTTQDRVHEPFGQRDAQSSLDQTDSVLRPNLKQDHIKPVSGLVDRLAETDEWVEISSGDDQVLNPNSYEHEEGEIDRGYQTDRSRKSSSSSLDPEERLLEFEESDLVNDHDEHEIKNAPIFTADALPSLRTQCPQRAVLGSILSQHALGFPGMTEKRQVYININTPFSSVVCGVQGSGKSHTASVLLEGCLLSNRAIGTLPKPLAGMCLHYDPQLATMPCEAAYISMPSAESIRLKDIKNSMVPVTVLVAPTSLNTMKAIYKALPYVTVKAFHLSPEILNARRMLSLMGCDETERMPLYLQRALTILREMGVDQFSYSGFKSRMQSERMSPAQKGPFEMRTKMLESYLTGSSSGDDLQVHFRAGHLVIIDLRDPFINTSMASALFEIAVELFLETPISSGKVLLLDEAHKYLSSNDNCSRFTTSIISIIRQQRHFGIRTLISTQEPTVIPHAILDLTSILIIHRFSSPTWAHHLSQHISINQSPQDSDPTTLISRLTRLRVGEAMIVAPSGLGIQTLDPLHQNLETGSKALPTLMPFSNGFLIARTRRRLTLDGGSSQTSL